jgi:F-type H+-transporting ATPase subunit b
MMELFQDTNFWVLVSFIIFIGVAWKYAKDAALAKIDGKIDAIRKELTEAERIRVDAQELLAEYQRKHKDALSEADKIIADAKNHAEDIRKKAEADMERTQARREAQLDEKLKRIEQNAAQEIEAYTAQIAVNAARHILADKMDAKTDKDIINNVMSSVPKTLN